MKSLHRAVMNPQANKWFIGAGVTTLVTLNLLLPDSYFWYVAALGSIGINLPYLLAAVSGGGHVRTEAWVSASLIVVTLIGVFTSPWLIIGAWVTHAVWDYLKHARHAGVRYVSWYPSACAVVDVVYPLFLVLFAPSF